MAALVDSGRRRNSNSSDNMEAQLVDSGGGGGGGHHLHTNKNMVNLTTVGNHQYCNGGAGGGSGGGFGGGGDVVIQDRLKKLYPAVNEGQTPLPRAWSSKDKYNYIGLSQNNLRVHYKGHGKTHRDAASVQATHPIPAACGLYYFEVRIVSKGRDGYMGIGLSAQGVNMNRLPGWDKHSYGYHGDDGHSFCSSGTGQPYGPTFTTGDVIGCGVNLLDNSCFYTKNGHHLGTAFHDLPPNLYPTVGLQTPGEIVDANFGQEPFVYDIEDMMRELRAKIGREINEFPVGQSPSEWQDVINCMVSTYLLHHGYSTTAEVFSKITDVKINDDMGPVRNRQKILKLILAGRMSEAIEKTNRLYPGVLEQNEKLLFMLKCRQFIEMVNGSDVEACHHPLHPHHQTNPPCTNNSSSNNTNNTGSTTTTATTTNNNNSNNNNSNSNSTNATNAVMKKCPNFSSGPAEGAQMSVIQSTKNFSNNTNSSSTANMNSNSGKNKGGGANVEEMNQNNTAHNNHNNNSSSNSGSSNNNNNNSNSSSTPVIITEDCDVEMANSDDVQNGHLLDGAAPSTCNGVTKECTGGGGGGAVGTSSSSNGSYQNGDSCHNNDSSMLTPEQQQQQHCDNNEDDNDEDMDVDVPVLCRKSSTKPAVERILEFGKELYSMSQKMTSLDKDSREANQLMLQDAFSLLAYSNPWASPVGWQLQPSQREIVCASLNSAILESLNKPKKSPMELAFAHAHELVRLMASSGLGSCAFATMVDYFNQ